MHNEKRALHQSTPALAWSSTLAVSAQAWADGCTFEHDGERVPGCLLKLVLRVMLAAVLCHVKKACMHSCCLLLAVCCSATKALRCLAPAIGHMYSSPAANCMAAANTNYGENLYAVSGSSSSACSSAATEWYNELTSPGYDFNNPAFQSGAGHFTQARAPSPPQLDLLLATQHPSGQVARPPHP